LVGLIAVLLVVGRPLMSYVTRNWREGQVPSGNLIALLLIGALACGLATDRIFGAGLVGGFLFGLAVPARPGLARAVIQRLEPAALLLFLPVFLTVPGLRIDLTLFSGSLIGGTLLFLALMIVGKWLAGYAAGPATGLADREAHAIGVLFNCRGQLILVVALIGLQLNVITPKMQLVFVIGALVTTMMTAPLVDVFPQRRATLAVAAGNQHPGPRRGQTEGVIGRRLLCLSTRLARGPKMRRLWLYRKRTLLEPLLCVGDVHHCID
jgi:Kef-type K+ transport system membrane component KefB